MIQLINATANQIPLPDNSVHCVVTSPPYWGLRDYGLTPRVYGGVAGCEHVWGEELPIRNPSRWEFFDDYNTDGKPRVGAGKQKTGKKGNQGQFCQLCGAWRGCLGLEPTPEMYVEHMVEIFREVKRVLRDDGTVWLNLGDSYAGSWGNYGAREGKQREQKAVKYERHAWDDFVQRPPMSHHCPGLKPKDLVGIPWRVAFALQADGWWLRSDIIWSKTNPMPESVTDRPTKAHEYLFLLSKSARYYYDQDAVREAHTDKNVINGTYQGSGGINKPSWQPHTQGWNETGLKMKSRQYNPAGRNRRTVWTISTKPYAGAHFATYPPALVEPCIKAGTSNRGVCPECGAPWERVVEKRKATITNPRPFSKPGNEKDRNDVGRIYEESERHTTGWRPTCDCCQVCNHYNQLHGRRKCPVPYDPIPATVLDPFVGSGTTLMVARQLGRNGIGLDLSFDYLSQQARKRLELDKLALWGEPNIVPDDNLPLFQGMA